MRKQLGYFERKSKQTSTFYLDTCVFRNSGALSSEIQFCPIEGLSNLCSIKLYVMKTKNLQSVLLLVAIFFSGMASYFAQPSNTIAVANPNVNALTVKPESVAKMMRLELIKINKYKSCSIIPNNVVRFNISVHQGLFFRLHGNQSG